MVKVGIFGASGYTGQELLRILLRHGKVRVEAVTSRRFAGRPVRDVYPSFTGLTELSFTDLKPQQLAENVDIVFLAVPHGVAMDFAAAFLETGRRLIDLSADFRLRDSACYAQWYGKHRAEDVLQKAVYGLPERYREKIREARLVANPGCYPTSVILGMAPLLKGNFVDTGSIIADSKSGVSGAGREPQIGSLFCEVDGGFKAYKIGSHRHTPEIEQELSALAGREIRITFTPHLLPVNRGILSTIYASLAKDAEAGEVLAAYQTFYRDEPFVRVFPAGSFPNVSSVRGSNYCDIGVAVDKRTRRVIVVAAIDNLIKGASGQAVQNMNLMCGFPETTGLDFCPLFP